MVNEQRRDILIAFAMLIVWLSIASALAWVVAHFVIKFW
jgi:hypothetical protein